MWYSYYLNSSGEWTKSKKFDNLDDFKSYACKHPSACFVASTSEPDFLGRAYSKNIINNYGVVTNEKLPD